MRPLLAILCLFLCSCVVSIPEQLTADLQNANIDLEAKTAEPVPAN